MDSIRSKLGSVLFLALIFGVPVVQAVHEQRSSDSIQALAVIGPLNSERLREYKRELRTSSLAHQFVTPWYQWLLTSYLGTIIATIKVMRNATFVKKVKLQ